MRKVKRRRRSHRASHVGSHSRVRKSSPWAHAACARVRGRSCSGLRPGLSDQRAAPTTAMFGGGRDGERSWPAAHGPGEEPEVRAPGPRLAPLMPMVPKRCEAFALRALNDVNQDASKVEACLKKWTHLMGYG